MLKKLLRRKLSRRVHIECSCPCGGFVPGHLNVDMPGTRWGCDRCGFTFKLRWEGQDYCG